MPLVNSNRYGQPYRFGINGGVPTIGSNLAIRQVELRIAPEQMIEGYNTEGHCVALAVSRPDRRKVLGSFTGYVTDSFSNTDIPAAFNFNSRTFIVRDIGDVRRKGEYSEVTVEGESYFHIDSASSAGSTPDFNYYGSEAFLEDQGRLTTDIFGLQTATARFKYPSSTPFATVPSLFDAHPNYGWLHIERQEIDVAPGFLIITNGYAGIAGGLSASAPIYELCVGVGEEPIETHPDFATTIAGTPSSPLNGAIFVDYETGKKTTDDDKGVFQEFLPIISGARNIYAGVTAFLSPDQLTWRERLVTTSRPSDISNVGHIDSPSGPAPSLGGSRNWLLMGITYEQRGIVYFVTTEWRASGPSGWITDIYA